MRAYLLIALGGSMGAVLRYLLSGWAQNALGGLFPWGTLFVNVVGSFLLGVFLEASTQSAVAVELRWFFAIGVLGAFTTFSTFSNETLGMLREGDWMMALTYALGSLVAGVAAALVGVWVASR